MNCPRCEEIVEDGAAFCGNCGLDVRQLNAPVSQAVVPLPSNVLQVSIPTEMPNPVAGIPAYALADPIRAKAEGKAMAGLIVSVLAVPAAIIPVIGFGMATIGLVLGSTGRQTMHRTMSNLAISFSCLAIVLSVAAFAYGSARQQVVQTAAKTSHDTNASQTQPADDTSLSVGSHVDTICYALDLPRLDHVEKGSAGCNFRAYDADTLTASSEVFTVDAGNQPTVNEANFVATAQQLVSTYLQSSLSGFVITSQQIGVFAASTAYYINAANSSSKLEIAIVLHSDVTNNSRPNIYVLAHGLDNSNVNAGLAVQSWEWKP